MARDPLLAGTFSAVPVHVQCMYGGRYMFVDDDGKGCWIDPQHRTLLHSRDEVRTVLMAHGYVLDEETLAVRPVEPPTTRRKNKS